MSLMKMLNMVIIKMNIFFFSEAETQPDKCDHIENVLQLSYKLWKIKYCTET